jgi:hypothetical protein
MTAEQQKVQAAFGPGWFLRACEAIERDTAHWPEWKKQACLQPSPYGRLHNG